MGISIWQLLIILAIVLVLFGANRLRNLGGDLGAAVRGFRDAVHDGEDEVDRDGKSDKDADGRYLGGGDDNPDEDFSPDDTRSAEERARDRQ